MQAVPKGPLIRADQVAEIVGVSPRLAAELMKQMPRINIGLSLSKPRWAVHEGDVHTWLQSRQTPAEVPGEKRKTARRRSIVRMDGLLDEHGHIPRRK